MASEKKSKERFSFVKSEENKVRATVENGCVHRIEVLFFRAED